MIFLKLNFYILQSLLSIGFIGTRKDFYMIYHEMLKMAKKTKKYKKSAKNVHFLVVFLLFFLKIAKKKTLLVPIKSILRKVFDMRLLQWLKNVFFVQKNVIIVFNYKKYFYYKKKE